MSHPVHMIYALAVIVSFVALLGPAGLIPAAIVFGAWAFVFYSDSRPRALAIVFVVAILGCCLWSVVMPVYASREAVRWDQCRNNLKLIGLALHNYSAEHGSSFPPAYIADDNGKPLLSWRVLLLPYLDRADLYQKFDLTKSWDSPENQKLLEHIPQEFACPSHYPSRQGAMTTSYVAIVGPRSAWKGASPMTLDRLTTADDHLSNTIMVIEHHSDIAWTEPRDLSLDDAASALASTNIESFRSHRSETFFEEIFRGRSVLFGDGAVYFAPFALEESFAKKFLTIDDQKPRKGWDFSTANNPPAARTKWRNVILFWTCVFFTLLPLPWVWIHPKGDQRKGHAKLNGD